MKVALIIFQVHTYNTYHTGSPFSSPDTQYIPDHEPDPYYIEPILTHHHLKEYKPYHYDISKTPEFAYINKRYCNLTFCLQDEQYPL